MTFWKTFLSCLLAIIVSSIASFILSIIVYAAILGAILNNSTTEKLTPNSVLVLDLNTQIVEEPSSDPMEYLDLGSMSLNTPLRILDIQNTLQSAAIDPQIRGVYIKIPMMMTTPLAVLYEIREMLQKFRHTAPEKFVMAYGDAYSQGAIYLSSVCSNVFLNPYGAAPLSGMTITPMFFKGTLEKLGVEPQIIRHGKFKGAVEPYTLSKLSTENKLQYQSLIDSQWNFLLQETAKSRGLNHVELNQAATKLSVTDATEALDAGLVDSLLYQDQVQDWMMQKLGTPKTPNQISVAAYKQLVIDPKTITDTFADNKIEIIVADGAIADTGGDGGNQIIGNALAKKIQKARQNTSIKAIVLRVNSPGGSVLASEVISREVELTVAEKPVVVSMGQYAASGGYWISTPANTIVSNPVSVTGSIGVFAMMFNAEKGLKNHLGITLDPVTTNHSADFGSIARGLSPLEKQVMQKSVDNIYQQFTQKVATNRNLTITEVDKIGQGRVWTGLQAKELGLVDSIGSLSLAVEIAAEQAGIQGNYTLNQSKTNSSMFSALFSGGVKLAVQKITGWFIDTPEIKLQKTIEQENGKVIARLPLDLHFTN